MILSDFKINIHFSLSFKVILLLVFIFAVSFRLFFLKLLFTTMRFRSWLRLTFILLIILFIVRFLFNLLLFKFILFWNLDTFSHLSWSASRRLFKFDLVRGSLNLSDLATRCISFRRRTLHGSRWLRFFLLIALWLLLSSIRSSCFQ